MMEILVSQKHNLLVMEERADLNSMFPNATKITHPTRGRLMAVPHHRDAVKLLRNLGYAAPAPILTQYDWVGDTPFGTQKDTSAMLSVNPRAYVLSTMGTGKTRAALYAADYLMKTGEIRKGIIVAPLSTLTPVWAIEIFRYFPHRKVQILHGTRAKRLEAIDVDADFYIVNHDGVHIVADKINKRGDIDLAIVDEIASFRNAKTRRWKALNSITHNIKFAWGLTGSPTPNEPLDAWAQCKLLTPKTVSPYYTHFRNQVMVQVTQFKWIPRPEANKIVAKAMTPSVRFTREDTIELPPVSTTTREVTLTPEQAKAYSEMLTKFHTELLAHEITAVNEGVKMGKLLQVCAGYVYDNHSETVVLDSSTRLAALKEIIEENDQKTIVFVPFIHAVQGVFKNVSKYTTAELIYGDTSKSDRDRIFAEFQNSPHPRVLVAHPKTMSHGLTLTAANTIVWYSPTTSNETYEQANARISRPSQKHKQLIVHMDSSPVERRVFARLAKRGHTQGILLDMLKGIDEG